MKLNKPKFWDTKPSFAAYLLYPFTIIVILIIFLKKIFTKKLQFNIKVICIGNIYIGGTGKTPTSIYIANELKALGKNPVIIRKFYKEHRDEHNLIRESFKNLSLNVSRVAGILEAEKMNYDTVILDDGYQDYKIKKDLNILCFNQSQLIGNGFILPSGPLRESLNSLREAKIVLINGQKDIKFENKILNINNNLEIFYTSYKPLNIDQFKSKKLFAVAGIGNPKNFFQLLSTNGLIVEKTQIYPDHHEFTKAEILNMIEQADNNNNQIIMTEKDYFKIKDFKLDKIEYLKVSLEINEKEKLLKTISKIYD